MAALPAMKQKTDPVAVPYGQQPTQPLRPLVLIVESHKDTRDLLKTLLELNDYLVVEVGDGEQAIAQAEKVYPDIVLMDTNLPGLDGLAVTQWLRKHTSLHLVPIIITSGNAFPVFRSKALAAGCNEFLVKPINFDQLDDILKRYIS